MALENNYRSREQEALTANEVAKDKPSVSLEEYNKAKQEKLESIRTQEQNEQLKTEKLAARLLSQIKEEDIATPEKKEEVAISYTPQKVASFMQKTKDEAKSRGYDMSRFSLSQFA